MTSSRHRIEVQGIPVEVVRKNIKHLHLGVYPPDGRIRVSVPLRINDEEVRLAVISRLGWISKRQKTFAKQERQSKRELVTGESHYYRGRRYRLDVIEENKVPTVRLANATSIQMRVRPGSSRDKRKTVLDRWYRQYLRKQIPVIIAKWEPDIKVSVSEWRIKRMKTKWGSCNVNARRIWINLELAKKPDVCLEYVVVHEMIHLHERLHNAKFKAYMDKFIPRWRSIREELNQQPVRYND